jgi:hypothetical protein
MKTTLKIWSEGHGEKLENAEDFEVKNFGVGDDLDLESAIEEYAEYFHDNCDGWDCSWPIIFSVADENGIFLKKVSVDRDMRPVFSGRVLK